MTRPWKKGTDQQSQLGKGKHWKSFTHCGACGNVWPKQCPRPAVFQKFQFAPSSPELCSYQSMGYTGGMVLILWLGRHPAIHLPKKRTRSSVHGLITLEPAGEARPIAVSLEHNAKRPAYAVLMRTPWMLSFLISCIEHNRSNPAIDGVQMARNVSTSWAAIILLSFFIAWLWHQRLSIWSTSGYTCSI